MHMLLAPLAALLAAALAAGAGPAPPPAAHRVAGVPLAEPSRDHCGPAALAAVLQYHGESVRAADIARDIHLSAYRGAINLDLLFWARQRGFAARAQAGSEEQLRAALARDLPVICMVRARGALADRNHFVVLRGYDETAALWYVDAGRGREEAVPAGRFGRDWAECGRWMLIVEGRAAYPERGPR